MKNTKSLTKNYKQNLKTLRELILMTIKMADEYKDDRAYEAALIGLFTGLNVYIVKKRNSQIDLYVSWFIKTSIEYSIGLDNKDTRIWKTKIKKKRDRRQK